MPLFCLEASLSLLLLLDREETGDDIPQGYVAYVCVCMCCAVMCAQYTAVLHGWNTERTQSVPFRLFILSSKHLLVMLGCPSIEGFSVDFLLRALWWDVSEKPQPWASKVAAAWSLPTAVLALRSTSGPSTSSWLPASSSLLWLAEKQGRRKGRRVPEVQNVLLRLYSIYQLIYHPIQEVAVYQWRMMFQQGTSFILTCPEGEMWKSISCDQLKGPQKRCSLH